MPYNFHYSRSGKIPHMWTVQREYLEPVGTLRLRFLAGGDCVEKMNFITGEPEGGRLRGPAVIQGRLAAKRLAGYDIPFPLGHTPQNV